MRRVQRICTGLAAEEAGAGSGERTWEGSTSLPGVCDHGVARARVAPAVTAEPFVSGHSPPSTTRQEVKHKGAPAAKPPSDFRWGKSERSSPPVNGGIGEGGRGSVYTGVECLTSSNRNVPEGSEFGQGVTSVFSLQTRGRRGGGRIPVWATVPC